MMRLIVAVVAVFALSSGDAFAKGGGHASGKMKSAPKSQTIK